MLSSVLSGLSSTFSTPIFSSLVPSVVLRAAPAASVVTLSALLVGSMVYAITSLILITVPRVSITAARGPLPTSPTQTTSVLTFGTEELI